MKLRYLTLVFIFLVYVSAAFACDINLFAIISGSSVEDEFASEMNALSEAVHELGTAYKYRKTGLKKLDKLMNLWLDFSARFRQFPPEWAARDNEWHNRIAHLSTIIGKIRSNLIDNSEQAHRFMLKFSRQLPQLYREMPMNKRTSILLALTLCFDQIWDAYYDKDLNSFRARITELSHKHLQLERLLNDLYQNDLQDFDAHINNLRRRASQINVFKTITIEMIITSTEDKFIQINEKISQETAP